MQDSGQIARMRSLNWVFVVRNSVWFLLFSWRESYQKFTVLLFATTNWATIITMVFERFKSCFSICSINWFKVKWNLQVYKIVIFDGGVSCLTFNLVSTVMKKFGIHHSSRTDRSSWAGYKLSAWICLTAPQFLHFPYIVKRERERGIWGKTIPQNCFFCQWPWNCMNAW